MPITMAVEKGPQILMSVFFLGNAQTTASLAKCTAPLSKKSGGKARAEHQTDSYNCIHDFILSVSLLRMVIDH